MRDPASDLTGGPLLLPGQGSHEIVAIEVLALGASRLMRSWAVPTLLGDPGLMPLTARREMLELDAHLLSDAARNRCGAQLPHQAQRVPVVP